MFTARVLNLVSKPCFLVNILKSDINIYIL